MEQLKAYLKDNSRLREYIPSERDWEIISSRFTKREFSRKTILTRIGETENHLNFITKGIARFYIPNEEKDLTFNIVFDNGFLSAYDSFLTQTPSTYNIETLTECTLLQLTYSDLQIIYNETEFGNIIGRLASEELFLKKQKRELSLLNLTAEQRYLNLFYEQPKLIQQIPLKYIASCIGITPQALSRIRKRIS